VLTLLPTSGQLRDNMQISSLKTEFDIFFTSMNQYTDFLIKITKTVRIILPPHEEKEILTKLLPAEKKQIHEAFALKICATWEILAENVFVECLLRDTSKYEERKGIITQETHERYMQRIDFRPPLFRLRKHGRPQG